MPTSTVPSNPHPVAAFPGYGYAAQPHPRGTLILILGIVSMVFSLMGPVAWVWGQRVLREIDADPGRYSNRGQVMAGWICGIVATAVMIFTLLLVLGILWMIGAATMPQSH